MDRFDEDQQKAHQAVEQAARDSYGRLLAFLVARSHDVAAAEDALSDAFIAALQTWSRNGAPDKPEAWLLVTARRKLMDEIRHRQVHENATPAIVSATEQACALAEAGLQFPDERLEMLFLCAHPAIEVGSRTPLMLQTVLGLDASRIASAFLVKPAAMGQRLTRAKAKIKGARIRFELPEARELPARLDCVLEAIYAAFGSGWDDLAGADVRRRGLGREGIELGQTLVRLMPLEPEAKGLLALMLHCEARRSARRNSNGDYVPLKEQDAALWSRELMDQAENLLVEASRAHRLGRFQLEAAIQSVHAQRAKTSHTDWAAIAALYEGLAAFWPTTGSLVGRAAAVAEARGAVQGWQLLEAIPRESVEGYQPYWAVAGYLLSHLGRTLEARDSYQKAIGLCEDSAMRAFLVCQAGKIP